jgi:hypothetical protein
MGASDTRSRIVKTDGFRQKLLHEAREFLGVFLFLARFVIFRGLPELPNASIRGLVVVYGESRTQHTSCPADALPCPLCVLCGQKRIYGSRAGDYLRGYTILRLCAKHGGFWDPRGFIHSLCAGGLLNVRGRLRNSRNINETGLITDGRPYFSRGYPRQPAPSSQGCGVGAEARSVVAG